MSQQDIHTAIYDFLDLLENGRGSEQKNIHALELALDRLALAYHFSEDEFDETDYPGPPKQDYVQLRDLVTAHFSTFGFYNVPSKVIKQIMQAELLMGDALDDVVDIGRDLLEVAWRWKQTSQKDALWHFRFGYENHWGNHLRNLSLYLYALRSESYGKS